MNYKKMENTPISFWMVENSRVNNLFDVVKNWGMLWTLSIQKWSLLISSSYFRGEHPRKVSWETEPHWLVNKWTPINHEWLLHSWSTSVMASYTRESKNHNCNVFLWCKLLDIFVGMVLFEFKAYTMSRGKSQNTCAIFSCLFWISCVPTWTFKFHSSSLRGRGW